MSNSFHRPPSLLQFPFSYAQLCLTWTLLMPTGTVQEDLCLLLWPDVLKKSGSYYLVVEYYLYICLNLCQTHIVVPLKTKTKELMHFAVRMFTFALLVFLSGCRWSVHRQSLLPATDHRPLYHPSGTPGSLLWLLEAAACRIFALHLLPVQTVGHTDLYVWSAPVGEIKKNRELKVPLTRRLETLGAPLSATFFLSFLSSWLGTVTSEET